MTEKETIGIEAGIKRGEALDDESLDQATGGRGGHNSIVCPKCGGAMHYTKVGSYPAAYVCECGYSEFTTK